MSKFVRPVKRSPSLLHEALIGLSENGSHCRGDLRVFREVGDRRRSRVYLKHLQDIRCRSRGGATVGDFRANVPQLYQALLSLFRVL